MNPQASSYYRFSWLLFGALACVTLLNAPAAAVTLDEAVKSALRSNLDLKAAAYEIEKAQGRLIQAGLWPNPAMEFGGRSDRIGKNEGERNLSVGFTQAFPVTGRLRLAKEVSRVDVAQAIVEIRNRQRLLIGEVERDFLGILLLRKQISSNREYIEGSRGFVAMFEQRLKKAEISQVEVNLAQIEIQRAELETAVLDSDMATRELALKGQLGMSPTAALRLDGTVEHLEARFLPGRYEPSMRVHRPDLRSLELVGDRAHAESRLAQAEAWQDWSVSLDYENERTSQENSLSSNAFAGFKISIPLALWNGNQGTIYEKQAAAEQSRRQVEALRNSIRIELATGIAQATRLKAVVENYQRTVLPVVMETTNLLTQGVNQGLTDANRLIGAQQQRASVRSSYLTAYTSYLQALVSLETASGTSPFLSKDFLNRLPLQIVQPRRSRSK